MTDKQRELTLYVVGESRNDATEHGLLFDNYKDANEWVEENNGLNVYMASVWLDASRMVEVEEEEDE